MPDKVTGGSSRSMDGVVEIIRSLEARKPLLAAQRSSAAYAEGSLFGRPNASWEKSRVGPLYRAAFFSVSHNARRERRYITEAPGLESGSGQDA